MNGPLLSITHSARSNIAASVTSARDGLPRDRPRNHHTEAACPHAREQQLRQLGEGVARFDFQDDAEPLGLQIRQPLLQLVNVFRLAHKRVTRSGRRAVR
jgi:hypothetical protein